MTKLDARGLACPMPVVKVQKAVKAENPAEIEILVDEKCAVENITRFGESQGYSVTYVADGDDFIVTLKK